MQSGVWRCVWGLLLKGRLQKAGRSVSEASEARFVRSSLVQSMVYTCTFIYFNNLLACCHILITFLSDEEYTVTLENIMMFTTGLTTFPPLGFPVGPAAVTFLHEDDRHGKSRFPKANTCACILMLPTTHQTYESFEHAMCYGIGNAGGFGFAWASGWRLIRHWTNFIWFKVGVPTE